MLRRSQHALTKSSAVAGLAASLLIIVSILLAGPQFTSSAPVASASTEDFQEIALHTLSLAAASIADSPPETPSGR